MSTATVAVLLRDSSYTTGREGGMVGENAHFIRWNSTETDGKAPADGSRAFVLTVTVHTGHCCPNENKTQTNEFVSFREMFYS